MEQRKRARRGFGLLVSHDFDLPDGGHSWDLDADSDDDLDVENNPEAAAAMFLHVMLGKYYEGAVDAELLCTLCYYGHKGGLRGGVEDLAYLDKPHSGNHQKFLDEKLGFNEQKSRNYEIDLPGKRLHDIARTTFPFVMEPAHEIIARAQAEDISAGVRLDEAIAAQALPESYFDHPVVRTSDSPPYPYGIYLDGLPYTLVDSVQGIWLIDILTGERYLIGLLRKRLVCECGCRGWCSHYAILESLRWSFEAAAQARFPSARHDLKAWKPSDDARAARAGEAMVRPAILLRIKLDWVEICTSLGFPTWASQLRPCFACTGSGRDLSDPAHMSLLDSEAWDENTDADYEAACNRCEIWISIADAGTHAALVRKLHFDKRDDGSHGRALLPPGFEPLGLRAGDRIEPHRGMQDVMEFDALTAFDPPVRVLFWRPSRNTICTHRCPLLDATLGITPTRSICVDLLHSLYLGPLLAWAKHVIWLLLDNRAWGEYETTGHEQFLVAVQQFRTELFQWYDTLAVHHPGLELTRVSDMRPSMLRKNDAPRLKTKAQETYGLVWFLLDATRLHGAVLGDQQEVVLESGRAVLRCVEIMKNAGSNLTQSEQQEAMSAWCRHRSLIKDLAIDLPKHHLMYHLIRRAAYQGNPWHYTVFLDESLNKLLKRMLRLCHQVKFEVMALAKGRELLRRWAAAHARSEIGEF